MKYFTLKVSLLIITIIICNVWALDPDDSSEKSSKKSTPFVPFNGFYAGVFGGGIIKNLKGKVEVEVVSVKSKDEPQILGFLY